MNSTEPAASSNPPITTSVRYERLLTVLRKALERSKQELDIPELIRQCYGADASILDNDNDQSSLLPQLIEHLLDKVNARVLEHAVNRILPEHSIEETLLRLENTVRTVRAADEAERRKADASRELTRKASEAAKLPPNVSPNDLIAHTQYLALLKKHDELQARVAATERKVQQLRQTKEQLIHQAHERVRQLQLSAREVERAADLCSMMS